MTVHPLVRQAARGLSPQLLEKLGRELPLLEGETLRDAVRELLCLAAMMTEDGVDAAALFALIESRPLIAALDRANASQVAQQSDRSRHAAAGLRGPELRAAPRKAASLRVEDLGVQRFVGLKLR